MNIEETIQAYFAKLGFTPEIAAIYWALYSCGPQSISQLSRTSKIERTRIYRLIEELESSNLVETELHYKRRIFRAAPIGNLQIVISKKEHELSYLKTKLDTLNRQLAEPNDSSPTSPVRFYRGIDGAKQMFWNQTKTHSEMLSILREPLQNKTDLSFFLRWVRAMNEREVAHRSIVSSNFLTRLETWRKHPNLEKITHWQARCLSEDVFHIAHETHIYDDITAYYNWDPDKMFGVEIRNTDIASTQRQVFEMLWQQAKPL